MRKTLTLMYLVTVFAVPLVWLPRARAQALPAPQAPQPSLIFAVLATNTIAAGASYTDPGAWSYTAYNGTTLTSPDDKLGQITFRTFTASTNGGYPSGANVTLAFVNGNSSGAGACPAFSTLKQLVANFEDYTIQQLSSGVVDQLDGDLYIKGDFGPSGWTAGRCSFVYVFPPTTPYSGPTISVTLAGTVHKIAIPDAP